MRLVVERAAGYEVIEAESESERDVEESMIVVLPIVSGDDSR